MPMAHVCSGMTQCANWFDPEVKMAKYIVQGNWDQGIKNHKQEMLHEDPQVEGIYKGSAVEEIVLALASGSLLHLQEVEDISME